MRKKAKDHVALRQKRLNVCIEENGEQQKQSDTRTGGETMSEGFISRGFRGRRKPSDTSSRLPPGQYLERGFPVLSAGPTPHTPLANWDFTIIVEVDQPKRWSWEEHPFSTPALVSSTF